MTYQVDVSLIIPAFNEERRLARTLTSALSVLNQIGQVFEIIVVDDGSTDKTSQIVLELQKIDQRVMLVPLRVNRGKGAAVKQGIEAARGRNVCFMDADGATPIQELSKLLDALEEGQDIAIGSRQSRRDGQSRLRLLGGACISWSIRQLALPTISDSQCGFKAFSALAASTLARQMTVMRYGFDIELLFLASRLGYSVKEIPVEWHHQEGSKVSPLKDGVRMLLDLIKIRLQYSNLLQLTKRGRNATADSEALAG